MLYVQYSVYIFDVFVLYDSVSAWSTHLFIELIDDAVSPLQMQVLALQRPIDVRQFNAHLADQQPVVLIGPVDTCGWIISHLEDQQTDMLKLNIDRCDKNY